MVEGPRLTGFRRFKGKIVPEVPNPTQLLDRDDLPDIFE
jgi:hypothetical protein